MGYTWTDGELITATKLNNTGGGGGIDALIYKERGTGNWQIVGDFNSALAKVQDGVPLVAIAFCDCIYSSVDVWWIIPEVLHTYYEDNTQTIGLRINSVEGFSWTSSGISYYD